jgi:hypothetical protein
MVSSSKPKSTVALVGALWEPDQGYESAISYSGDEGHAFEPNEGKEESCRGSTSIWGPTTASE